MLQPQELCCMVSGFCFNHTLSFVQDTRCLPNITLFWSDVLICLHVEKFCKHFAAPYLLTELVSILNYSLMVTPINILDLFFAIGASFICMLNFVVLGNASKLLMITLIWLLFCVRIETINVPNIGNLEMAIGPSVEMKLSCCL